MRKTSRGAKKKKAANGLRPLPPRLEAAFKAVRKMLSKMSAHEIFLTAVKSGIYTKGGKLKKPYAPQPDDHLAR